MEASVTAGSRLHAGFHIIGDSLHRIDYAGAGFYAETPRVTVKAWDCGEQAYKGPPEFEGPITLVMEKTGFKGCIELSEAPPRHIGLGSTTQVALAAYHAVMIAMGASLSREQIVEAGLKLLGRTKASTVGTLLYAYGGFALDTGVPVPSRFKVLRLEVPEDWRYIIVLPSLARGLNEDKESHILERPPLPGSSIRDMMSKGVHQLLTGIIRGSLELALEGLKWLQTATGHVFSTHQGGIYRRDLERIVAEASRDGIILAQSSWGPALYTITTADSADSDWKTLRAVLREAGVDGVVIVSRPRNSGGGPG